MKIGIFNPTLHVVGGAEYATIIMMNALKKHGNEVIVSSNKKIDQKMAMRVYGAKVTADAQIVFPLHNLFGWNPNHSQFFYINALQIFALRLNCNILIDVFSGVILPWADIIYFQTQGRDITIKRKREVFLLPYIALLKSTRIGKKIILTCSKFVAQNLEKKSVYCNVLYPPVDVHSFHPNIKQRNEPRKDIVMTISRFTKEKKLEKIPYIAKLVDKNISFNIVGSPHDYETLSSIKRLIKRLNVGDRVKLSVNISREELKRLLWNSKVYLHTREYEPFGITIVEAMSGGCIPVVHDSGGPREFVPENLRYKTIEEGAMKIERAIAKWSTKKMEEMTKSAKNFDKEKFSQTFLNIVDQAIEVKSKK